MPRAKSELTVRIRVGTPPASRIQILPLDEYVRGCVAAEIAADGMSPDTLAKALRLQAMLSRTYGVANLGRHRAEGFDLCDTTHCQLFRPSSARSPLTPLIDQAVSQTAGTFVVHEGRPIQALFHAACGGRTSAAEDVWGGPGTPYLRAVPDPFCTSSTHARWEFRAEAWRVHAALNLTPSTRPGSRFRQIAILDRDETGRARRVAIEGSDRPVVRGEDFRAAFRNAFGPRALRSTWFTVRRDGTDLVFDGRGYGHGVGLCQTGAFARLRAGADPEAVIRHFYSGARLAWLDPQEVGRLALAR